VWQGRVSSPTFIIARQHRAGDRVGAASVPLVHVDAYRLGGDLDELDALDLDTDLNQAVRRGGVGQGCRGTSHRSLFVGDALPGTGFRCSHGDLGMGRIVRLG